jgi:peptidoglycan/LPS O-acetylase OafA/YrhL
MRLFSKLISRHPGSDYATAVRGLAALAVFGVHGSAASPFLTLSKNFGHGQVQLENLSNLGAAGPMAFFITSGFVLSLVWEKQRADGYMRYAFRRYLRLTPLYFLVLIYCLFSYMDFTFIELIFRLIYFDAFYQPLFLGDPIGILWTISIEFWLSLCIPLFNYLFFFFKRQELVLFVAFFISTMGPILLLKLGLADLMAWKSIISSLFCFMVGTYLSTLTKSIDMEKIFRFMFVFSFGFGLMYIWGGFMGPSWVTILITSSYLGLRRTQLQPRPQNSVLVWLGTICYGVYLIHPIVLVNLEELSTDWAFYISLPPVLFLASLSWIFIEKPFTGIYRAR